MHEHSVLNFIGIIIFLVLKESGCNTPRPFYRNNAEKFRNIAVTPHYVYIGGNSKIIQLNSSLKHQDEGIIVNEKTNYQENWLLTVFENKTLIVCNYESEGTYHTRCEKYIVGPTIGSKIDGTSSIKIVQPSTKYLTTTIKGTNVLLIASDTCIHIHSQETTCYAILNFEMNLFGKFNPVPGILDYAVTYNSTTSVTFKTAFKAKKFIYFLFNIEGHSKLGKICTSFETIHSNSYEDTPIICSHNNNNYILAQDAVFWEEYLYVAFSDDSSSVICRYNLTAIKAKFMESRQDRLKCPYINTRNRYFKKQVLKKTWCFNKTSGLCHDLDAGKNKSCSEVTDDNDGFCNTQLFGSVEGTLPIASNDVIFTSIVKSPKNGAVVKLGVVPYQTHAIIHAGTSDGMIGQIFVTGSDQKVLDKFKTVQKSFPVLDIQVLNEDVYVMTQNMVVKVAEKKPCSYRSTCEDCMKLTNPACGWHILHRKCEEHTNTRWWLPSLGGQCLKLKVDDLFIKESAETAKPQELEIRFKFEPYIDFYNVVCLNSTTREKQTADEADYLACNMSVRDGDRLRVGIDYNNTVYEVASATVQLLKCSSLLSCKRCTSRGHCHWCLKTTSCVMDAGNCSSSPDAISEEQQCPAVISTNVLIHQNQKQDLKIYVDNIDSYKNKLKCIIDGEEIPVEIKIENQKYIECEDVKIKPPKLGNLTIYLEYDGSRLDGSSSLEVYDCKDFGDDKKDGSCGYCKYKKTQGYKCDWCSSCTYTDDDFQCNGNSLKWKCSISISKLEPSSGPVYGGTLVSFEGKNVGNQGDNIAVKINGAVCTNVTVVKHSKKISCITGNATGSSSIGINVTVNREIYLATNIKYTYVGQHVISSFSPNRSIIAGGKKILITGNNIIFQHSEYEIYFCNDSDSCLQCRFAKIRVRYIMCRMDKSSSILILKYLKVIIDKNTVLRKNGSFMIVGNPKLDLDAEISPVFKSGGSKITIRGSGFSNVGEVAIEGVEKLCTIKSNESVECETPPYVESDFNRKKRATGQNVNIHFDGYVSSYTIYYTENPEFDKLTNVVEYEDGKEGAPIIITGRNLREGAHQSDYTVKIGLDGTCLIQHMSNWNITCLPPKSKPRTNHSDERIVFVVVEVGNIQENLGNIRYIKALQILPIVIGVLGTALLVSVVIVVTVVLASKRKRRGAEKKFQMELLVLEDKIRETSREEFADAQMTIRDIKSDLVTSRVPYCDYQSYAFHQLFPNQDMGSHSLLFEPMVTDDNRLKVQKAMDMFDKLMTNKLFMKSLVQTLEHQNKLTMQDKAQFASLLSVCLLGNMKLFYQLISCLLIDMIKTANKKQHKVLFRRFDTITQRLMVNWLELSLYDHLKKNGGMQLFMLYKATQTVIEKAPIDAITVLCKNTLAEERLLKNRVEHEILTLDIDLNGNSDQRIPVIVLDCDTITQVKKKCCTAIYKNQPASEIPSPDELELEWHSGKSGKLTLQDIDSISDRSNGMVRLNTLKHYMVKNGSVMALMYKESTDQDDIYVNQGDNVAADGIEDEENQHVQGSVPTSPDHVKLLIPETTTDSQEHKWHLVACSKNNRDVENFPEKSNLPDEEKSNKEHEIGEIFLNRLFHTKLILRDYIEACFEGITDSQSLSIPVRYFLCMIDKQGKEVGVDGDILQSWKSECYATRVWASLIAKPQILFDVNVPSHVEPCMDILKQVFIDSFTQCPQHVTKDASTQKLLFCKDIPEYRKNVNSFFMKVEAVNDQEFWTAMDEISKEQTRKMKFSRQATLHQLYKFIDKYKDEIIEDFQEKDETKDLAFGNKLEEVIDLMEES